MKDCKNNTHYYGWNKPQCNWGKGCNKCNKIYAEYQKPSHSWAEESLNYLFKRAMK